MVVAGPATFRSRALETVTPLSMMMVGSTAWIVPSPVAPVTPTSKIVPLMVMSPCKPALTLVRSNVPPGVPLPTVRVTPAPLDRVLARTSRPPESTTIEEAALMVIAPL